jgi:hypothetical protein
MIAARMTPAAWAVLGVAGVAALYLMRNNAQAIGSGAVGAAVDAGVGVVQGIGQAVGVPVTNVSQCDADIAAGRTWDASFSCPAGRWIMEGVFGRGETVTPARRPTLPPAVETWGREVRTNPVFTGGASGSW